MYIFRVYVQHDVHNRVSFALRNEFDTHPRADIEHVRWRSKIWELFLDSKTPVYGRWLEDFGNIN